MKIISAFSLIILLMMSGIAPILVNSLPNKIKNTSVENVSPLLVMFGDSEAEIAAGVQLLHNFSNSIIIDFSASKQQIMEYTAPVIYIGHSSEEGISYSNQLVQWSFLSSIIGKSVSNNHYILGCNSQTISELTAQTGKNVVSFDFEIGALVGAGIFSLQIAVSYGINDNFRLEVGIQTLKRLAKIKENPNVTLKMPLLDPGTGGGSGDTGESGSSDEPDIDDLDSENEITSGLSDDEFAY